MLKCHKRKKGACLPEEVSHAVVRLKGALSHVEAEVAEDAAGSEASEASEVLWASSKERLDLSFKTI
jgi:hypothetical protein